jgi:uncharacterized protein (DUF2236 family)
MELLFPRGSVTRIVASRPGVMAVAAGRAILMQLANPDVAAGIDEHSTFKTDPIGRVIRTTEAFRRFFWRTVDEAEEVAARIRAQHAKVKGQTYSAEDPALLLWVHATTIDSLMLVYSKLVRPLSMQERERYYEESKVIAEMLGCPREYQPETLCDFQEYVGAQVSGLRASETGRALARDFLFFPVRPWARPITATYRHLLVGYLPDRIRRELDIAWRMRHRMAWRAESVLGVPVRSLRARIDRRDIVESVREGTCGRCGAITTIKVPAGICLDCSRAAGDARLERFVNVLKLMGLPDSR